MTTTATTFTMTTTTYRVDVIERIPAEYRVDAQTPRAAAEGWADGDLVHRDDEALDTEGPTAVWERRSDGDWRKVPPSEWREVGPAVGAGTADGAGANAEARAFLGTIARLKIDGEDDFVQESDDAIEALRSLIVEARRLAGAGCLVQLEAPAPLRESKERASETSDRYFLGASGSRYDYSDIADRIHKEAPQTLGKHIFVQLEALGLLREFQEGTTPCGLPFTFAESTRIAKFSARHDVRLPDHVFVTLDDRFDIALIRTADGLTIEVFPITDGQVWDNPFDRFDVDEEVIRALEREMGDD